MDYEDDEPEQTRKQTAAKKRQQLRDAVRNVLASSDGRLVLASCVSFCGIDIENVANGETAFRIEGARAVGIRIMRMLREADKELYLKLQREMIDG